VVTSLLTYLRGWALPEKLPIVQPFRKFPAILRNVKVDHRVHKSPPLVPILSQFDPIHTIPSYLRSILILSTHLHLGLPSGLFPSGFPTNILYAFLVVTSFKVNEAEEESWPIYWQNQNPPARVEMWMWGYVESAAMHCGMEPCD
jgi:hypothetical protein